MSEVFDHTFWQRLAAIDLEVIEACLAWPNPPWEGIALHSQQAAEKYLKAFLAFKGELPPRSHNLNDLMQRCLRYWPALSDLEADCQLLTGLAVDSRYEEFIEDAEETATVANAAADRICNRIKELL